MARAMSGSSTADGQSNKAFSATKNVLRLICLMHALTSIDRINVNTAGPVFQKDLHLTHLSATLGVLGIWLGLSQPAGVGRLVE